MIGGFYESVSAQFPQGRRHEERRRQAIEADEKRQRENAESAAAKVPQPKPSVVNKNVRIVLSGKSVNNFDEAAAAQKSKVVDGDDLWLYVKFDTKVGDYVRTVPDTENGGTYKYLLYADVSPQGDLTVISRYVIRFTRDDLELKELKVNLSPGMAGRNAAIPIFVNVAATRKPGLWTNQIRIANTITSPRMLSGDLASADLAFDFSGGNVKYAAINEDFESMILRGTAERSVLPAPGNFYSLPLKTRIQNSLKEKGITAVHFYYASDDWSEFGASILSPVPRREVFAVFTYRENANCFYGVAKLSQQLDALTSAFSGGEITFTRGIKTSCTAVE